MLAKRMLGNERPHESTVRVYATRLLFDRDQIDGPAAA
jgi:hypothetical protein